jgi:hypothetical protein
MRRVMTLPSRGALLLAVMGRRRIGAVAGVLIHAAV